MSRETNLELNFLGNAWYLFRLFLILLGMALVWIWAFPGLALEWILAKLGWQDFWVSFCILALWLGPLWVFSLMTSKPPNREVPQWARKMDKK